MVVLKFPRWFLVYNLQWKFENETKLSISMAWIGKRPSGEASVSQHSFSVARTNYLNNCRLLCKFCEVVVIFVGWNSRWIAAHCSILVGLREIKLKDFWWLFELLKLASSVGAVRFYYWNLHFYFHGFRHFVNKMLTIIVTWKKVKMTLSSNIITFVY